MQICCWYGFGILLVRFCLYSVDIVWIKFQCVFFIYLYFGIVLVWCWNVFLFFWYCVSIVLVFVCVVLGSVRFDFRNVLVWFRYVVVGMAMFCFSVQFGLI